MYFPAIGELATTDVVSVTSDSTLDVAARKLRESGHHSLIVLAPHGFCTLCIRDILRVIESRGGRMAVAKTKVSELSLNTIATIGKHENILTVLERLHFNFEEIAVTDSDGSLYGIVTYADIISSIDPETLRENFRLGDFLRITRRIRWVGRKEPTLSVLEMLEESSQQSVIVVEDRCPVGVVTTKDMLELLCSGSDLSLPIEHYMVHPVKTMEETATISEALRFMQQHDFNRIVTVDKKGCLVGIVTRKELMTLTYNRWIKLLKQHEERMSTINKYLKEKSETYEKIASYDGLTGLYNRMKFIELFVIEYELMVQRHYPMSVIMMDIDRFKSINDTFGHNTGDRILKQTADTLRDALRNVDIVCRWGGEEFVMLLPAADADEAVRIAEGIRRRVETMKSTLPAITGSFGVTEVKEGDTLEKVIERADKALYRSKQEGRNRVSRL